MSLLNQLERDGFAIRYHSSGQGMPILMIGCAIYYPKTFSSEFMRHFNLISMDHRGFAKAPDRDVTYGDFELDKIIDDIEQLRQHLKLDKIIIAGHSGHSYMALEYAKKYPEHVSHVMMIGITPNLGKDYQSAVSHYWQDSVCPQRKEAFAKSMQQTPDALLEALSPSDRFIANYIRNTPMIWFDYHYDAKPLWEGIKLNIEAFDHLWGNVFQDIDITQGLDKFNIPIFLALGRYDYIAPYHLWAPIRDKFKNLTIRVFEESGHTPQLEQASAFNRELIKWIKE